MLNSFHYAQNNLGVTCFDRTDLFGDQICINDRDDTATPIASSCQKIRALIRTHQFSKFQKTSQAGKNLNVAASEKSDHLTPVSLPSLVELVEKNAKALSDQTNNYLFQASRSVAHKIVDSFGGSEDLMLSVWALLWTLAGSGLTVLAVWMKKVWFRFKTRRFKRMRRGQVMDAGNVESALNELDDDDGAVDEGSALQRFGDYDQNETDSEINTMNGRVVVENDSFRSCHENN